MGKCLEICTMAFNDFPSKQQSDRPSVGREGYGFDSTALALLSEAVHGRKWHEPKTGFSKHDTESANTQLNATRQRCCSPHQTFPATLPLLYIFRGLLPFKKFAPQATPPSSRVPELDCRFFHQFFIYFTSVFEFSRISRHRHLDHQIIKIIRS